MHVLLNWFTRLFGSRNQRLLARYGRVVAAANQFESGLQALDDAALRARTAEFRQRLADGATLDSLIPEAFAVVREAARRTLGLRHFDMQLVGGLVLHEGKIAEMRTGEGKTLVATLPAYLNALPARGVHIVTVNEYLAQRDSDWMGPVYRFLGLEVGVIRNGQTGAEKRAAYAADITYGTNNEFGFDYLRDNLAFRREDQVQRALAYAVVDEVDSILIDEARTPLIISGPADDSSDLYQRINKLVPHLVRQERVATDDDDGGPGDYAVDEKARQVFLTEEGHQKVEELMVKEGLLTENDSLYDAANIRLMHHLTAALRAHALFRKNVEYIVRNGEVVIVDEFTGRTMPGRRWSDGLHQAVEAKEGVHVREENQTVASITFQNYFRLYDKLAGMTGTADTEAFEFQQIYGLEVVVIPTHRPMIRKDQADLVYLTQKEKFDAIIEDIKDCQQRGQPVLVGTTSIETSEYLAGLLQKDGVPHQVLNAKQHEREAHVVAEAGRPGAVTIATNMAGRGTDIVLGGNLEAELSQLPPEATDEDRKAHRAEWQQRHDQVLAAGGLRIIGTERHESRRIDNQLRGRSGRQGDPGSSRFYLSIEDNLMRIFGDPERTKNMLRRVGMRDGEAIESNMLTGQIERAQRKVEAHNFDARKSLLEYDDVANDQRRLIYQQRNNLMQVDDISESLAEIRTEVVNGVISEFIPPDSVEEQWDVAGLSAALETEFGARLDIKRLLDDESGLDEAGLRARILAAVEESYLKKFEAVEPAQLRVLEKQLMLQQVDLHWKEHLAAMDYLRQGIHLRGYAQKNPKQEYKREAFEMFGAMLDQVKRDVVTFLAKARVRSPEEIAAEEERRRMSEHLQFLHDDAPSAMVPEGTEPEPEAVPATGGQRPLVARPARTPAAGPVVTTPVVRGERKVGRNEPCPCGSGKKYKQCHGRLD
ncbi:MAG: preprotein translocase subunit SecA [Gammaproteobacteria bacterium]|nr:preprotein translocase subunit SecA [Gammaproteobacteria bacterium]